MRTLKLVIGIERSVDSTFTDKGLIKIKCPNCDCPIEIELKTEDKTFSPSVSWQILEVKK